jgi:hypothetical protein
MQKILFLCRGGEVLDDETGSQLELDSLTLAMWANYTCSAVNLAGTGGAEPFLLEIFGKPTTYLISC